MAWIGADGLLKVGPHSAGADPGPACYGRGGKEPTVTDANLLLGALSPESILAGRMALDQDLARAAIRQVAMRLGLDVLEVAAGILRVVNNNMAIELRLALQERGHDPRKFVLVAFGGAGPLHAGLLARALNIPRVLVPRHPGITSAAGLLQTQVRHFYLQSAVGLLSQFPVGRMNEVFDQLESRARQDANEEGFAGDVLEISRQVDLRYLHQGYHLTVDCSADPLKGEDKPKLRRAFDNLHQRLYGQSAPNEEAEVVTFRLVSQVSVPRLHLPEIEVGDESAEHAVRGQRQLFELERGAFVAARVYDRARLLASNRLRGPAIVEEFDSTTVVLAGQEVRIDRYGNLIIETGATA